MGAKGPFRTEFLEKLDAKDRRPMGKAGLTAAEAIDKKATRDEKADHQLVMGWVRRNELECIHAPTWRRVHDLPPGWPDFTLFWGHLHLFVELKSAEGRLSKAQREMKEHLERQGSNVYIKYSYDEVRRLFMGWLWEVARWTPIDPE